MKQNYVSEHTSLLSGDQAEQPGPQSAKHSVQVPGHHVSGEGMVPETSPGRQERTPGPSSVRPRHLHGRAKTPKQ